MSTHTPRILVVGAITVDDNRILPTETPFKADGKVSAATSEIRLGGGAGNCVQALKKLDEAYGTETYVKLITRLGRPPASNLRARLAHMAATEILADSEIDYVDATKGESALAFNAVTEHRDGRNIVKDVVENPLEMAVGIEDTIDNEVRGADLVFVDPMKPRMGVMAARSANSYNKPLVVDWGQSIWPKESTKAGMINEILGRTDILMVPSDAVVEGMPDHTVDPSRLMNKLIHHYQVPNVLMSDGSKPVYAALMGEDFQIPVLPWHGQKYALAAGDTRNAGFLHALSRGHSVLGAAQIGTAVASVKIRHPGLQWAHHVKDTLDQEFTFRMDREDNGQDCIIL